MVSTRHFGCQISELARSRMFGSLVSELMTVFCLLKEGCTCAVPGARELGGSRLSGRVGSRLSRLSGRVGTGRSDSLGYYRGAFSQTVHQPATDAVGTVALISNPLHLFYDPYSNLKLITSREYCMPLLNKLNVERIYLMCICLRVINKSHHYWSTIVQGGKRPLPK